MYPSGYTQDTSRYIRIRILITNPPKLDNNPPRAAGHTLLLLQGGVVYCFSCLHNWFDKGHAHGVGCLEAWSS